MRSATDEKAIESAKKVYRENTQIQNKMRSRREASDNGEAQYAETVKDYIGLGIKYNKHIGNVLYVFTDVNPHESRVSKSDVILV